LSTGAKNTKITKMRSEVENAVLSGYITTLNIKQKIDVSSEGPSSRVSSNIGSNITTQHSIFTLVLPTLVQTVSEVESLPFLQNVSRGSSRP
jgi:hypothetical protein